MDDMDMAPFEDEAEESDGKENADTNEDGGDESKGKKKTVKPKKVSNRVGTLDDMVNR